MNLTRGQGLHAIRQTVLRAFRASLAATQACAGAGSWKTVECLRAIRAVDGRLHQASPMQIVRR